ICMMRDCQRRFTFSFYFFFQAEDGIRDRNVTGVQTCALPIFFRKTICACILESEKRKKSSCSKSAGRAGLLKHSRISTRIRSFRSEERRVGKECRSGGARYHEDERMEEW